MGKYEVFKYMAVSRSFVSEVWRLRRETSACRREICRWTSSSPNMRITSLLAALVAASTLVDAKPLHQRLQRRSRGTPVKNNVPSVTTTCSYTENPNPAGILHCGVYGTLSSIDLLYNVQENSYGACRDNCINNSTCISFGYNYTSSNCAIYGRNLVSWSRADIILY